MFQQILIPIDFSEDSYFIIRCLSQIPAIQKLVLLYVTKNPFIINRPDFINPEADYARLRLEEMKSHIDILRSRIFVIIEEIPGGSVAEHIQSVAIREDISLIMMGRRGRGFIQTLLIGSTSADLLKYGTTNLFLLHPPGSSFDARKTRMPCPDLFSRILLCDDFSRPYIEDLAIPKLIVNKPVTLLHVITHGESEEEVTLLENSARSKLEMIQEKLSLYTRDIVCEVRSGDAAGEILSYAEEKDISMIVLKSTGEKGFIRNLLGSTAESVARTTKKPVLVLRDREYTDSAGLSS